MYDLDIELIQRFRIDYGEPPPGENPLRNVTATVADHERGIMYVTNRSSVWAFRNDQVVPGTSDEPVTLGVIARFGQGSFEDLEIDSHGNLYVSHYNKARIHKYTGVRLRRDTAPSFPVRSSAGRASVWANCSRRSNPVCDVGRPDQRRLHPAPTNSAIPARSSGAKVPDNSSALAASR